MDAVRQQDKNPRLVAPHARPGKPHVTPRAWGEPGPGELPAEPALVDLRAGRLFHERGRNELAAHEALHDPEDVARRGEETGVADGPPGVERVPIVRFSPHQPLAEPGEDHRARGAHAVLEALPPLR